MTTISFNPDPATTDAILQAIAADYSLSLTDIASQHQTTIEALTAWLTREDIDERLTAIENACARRARLTAANHLPAVANVAKQALEEASDVLRLPPDYRTQRSIALRIRATESARRAAALLLRIANFTPSPRRIRHHAAPTSPCGNPLSATIIALPTASAQSAPTPEPRIESTLPASSAAPRTECSSAAPTDATPTDRSPSTPTAATPTASAPTTSPSAPPTDRAPSAPKSATTTAAPTASAPATSPPEPISATSAARTTSARHAAIPRHVQYSVAISERLTLIPASADSAPHWSPTPVAHPPPT